MKKQYHGWIFAERENGMKDFFSVQYRDESGQSITRAFGYGETGAANAVDHFESTLKLGPVKLEKTPLGLRVFTEETCDTAPLAPSSTHPAD
jgi:hypothetical protein